MKKILLALCFVALAMAGMAESVVRDVVKLKDGSVVKGSIIEMTPNQSVQLTTQDGNILVYQMADILEISHEEIAEVSDIDLSQTDNAGEEDDCSKGRLDAISNYDGKGALTGATWATTLITSPLFGMIPAFIGAYSEPHVENLNITDKQTYDNNSEYRNCYNQEAKQIKQKKALKAYAISTSIWAILSILITSLTM